MSLFLRLAARNVFRNRARTAVALLAIAAGCAALIVNGGIIYNIFRELREDAIYGRHGHLRIAAAGYTEHHLSDPDRYLIPPDQTARLLEILRATPHVAHVTRRREFTGMISRADRYVSFMGLGVEPEEDRPFSTHVALRSGRELASEDPYGVAAGKGLAEKIGSDTGALMTVMVTTRGGALSAADARLRGIFEGGLKEFDDWTLKMPLASVEELLLDHRTEQVVLLLDRTESLPAVRAALASSLRGAGLDLEIRSWDEVALFHNQVVGLFGRELGVIKLIIATIVVLGIGNAIAMSVLERRVELSALRALGLREGAIARLIFLEAAVTGVLGGALGLALGVALAGAISAIGISFPSPPGSTRPFIGAVDLVPGVLLFAFVLAVAASLAAAILPVWRLVRSPIAETLRQG